MNYICFMFTVHDPKALKLYLFNVQVPKVLELYLFNVQCLGSEGSGGDVRQGVQEPLRRKRDSEPQVPHPTLHH